MPALPLPDIDELSRLIDEGGAHLNARVVCEVEVKGRRFDVHAITMGQGGPDAPAVGFFGGVHGLERIGAEVVMAYLRSLIRRLAWDGLLREQLAGLHLVFMPLVNPGGLWLGTRANPQGVDLMRNAPVDAIEPVPWLIGGQRLSPTLPWYRGQPRTPMQLESAALCAVVEQELLTHPFSIAVDCHSGFGVSDRIWFPYAHTSMPIDHLAELHALREIFDQTHCYHRYVFEPQSQQYLTHGDLWDHLYRQARLNFEHNTFLPLTLEMGSWLWVKKNPRQLFSRHGIFNPLIRHRQERVLRRHMGLLDFIARAACSHAHWSPQGTERVRHHEAALAHWYAADHPARMKEGEP